LLLGPRVRAYPFSAVVGADDLRLALLLNAVDPGVGGVLVRGEKGTAKSTTVRALAALLPALAVVDGCRFSCDPHAPDPACPDGPHRPPHVERSRPTRIVELPVGASEDRLVGALDLERALTEGVRAFEPGLLAAAHRGVLYVDEVNLLHDHLVDLLLDAAAMGRAHVEREGVSVSHAARLLLVGTMNPEEGELRPQLLDRFGLAVDVTAPRDPVVRAEVVRRRMAHDADPAGFAARWAGADRELADRVGRARALLRRVVLGDAALRQVTSVCAAFDVDGMRADLVTARAAVAHAAWEGRTDVLAEDVRRAALLALPHRRRRDPFDAPGLDEDRLDDVLAETATGGPDDTGPGDTGPGDGPDDDGPDGGGPGDGGPRPPESSADGAPERGPEQGGAPGDPSAPGQGGAPAPDREPAPVGAPFRARLLTVPGVGEGVSGRRSPALTPRGRTTGSRAPAGRLAALHLTATLRAAAPHQVARGRRGPGLLLRRGDLRAAIREGREGNLVLFALDTSGSMAARERVGVVTGAVLSLLLDAYQRRDKVGLVTFRGTTAEVALPPTSSVDLAAARLRALRTGGRTPLAAGLLRARTVLAGERLRDPARRPLLVVVTDGRATGGPDPRGQARSAAALLAAEGVASVVVDCERGPVRLGLAGELATALRAEHLPLAGLDADALAGSVRPAVSSRRSA
jgi:magnesium chelatase subunit D